MTPIWTGRTGMRVVLSGNSVQLWPDRSPVAITMTASEWADVADCAASYRRVEVMQDAERLRSAGEPGHRQDDSDQDNAKQTVKHNENPT